jgi:hypothetical protein
MPNPAVELFARNARAAWRINVVAQRNPTMLFSNDLESTTEMSHVKARSFL